jgi:predicted transcriptional regulator
VDDIPRIIDAAVIRPLPSAISKALLEHLVTVGKDEIERLMAEPAPLAAERAELNLRKTRLEEAKRVLVSFGRSVD